MGSMLQHADAYRVSQSALDESLGSLKNLKSISYSWLAHRCEPGFGHTLRTRLKMKSFCNLQHLILYTYKIILFSFPNSRLCFPLFLPSSFLSSLPSRLLLVEHAALLMALSASPQVRFSFSTLSELRCVVEAMDDSLSEGLCRSSPNLSAGHYDGVVAI